MRFFSNFDNGMEILKQALTQLLLYYTRFQVCRCVCCECCRCLGGTQLTCDLCLQDLINAVWRGRPPPFAKHVVNIRTIFFEIKKYNRSALAS